MRILVFTEGTVLVFRAGKSLGREERVKISQGAGIQREERKLSYLTKTPLPPVKPGSPYDFATHLPMGKAVEKLRTWRKQGATIMYLTSRRIKQEIDTIKDVLKKYDFPDRKNLYFRRQNENLYFRRQNEDYKDVAEKLVPDILIEDDCESIGGKKEMTYTFIKPALKRKIKLIAVKEFGGIDHLPDDLDELLKFRP
jgi:hypothetical protein